LQFWSTCDTEVLVLIVSFIQKFILLLHSIFL